jgi:hypothetical protein
MINGLLDHLWMRQGNVEGHINAGLTHNSEDGTIHNLVGSNAAKQHYAMGQPWGITIEDSVFDASANSMGNFLVDTDYVGAKYLIRHNVGLRIALYEHWTEISHVNWSMIEAYNNYFLWDGTPTDIPLARLQGGGLPILFNNTVIGYPNTLSLGEDRIGRDRGGPLHVCDGSHLWDGGLDPSAPGYPCLYQTGRDGGLTVAQIEAGAVSATFPAYAWNNGAQLKCSDPSAEDGPCVNYFSPLIYNAAYFKGVSSPHPNGDVEYCGGSSLAAITPCGNHTLTFAQWPYPFPLDANGMPDYSGGSSLSPSPNNGGINRGGRL